MLELDKTITELQDWLDSANDDDAHIIFLVETAIQHMKMQRDEIKMWQSMLRESTNRVKQFEGRLAYIEQKDVEQE